VIDAGSNDRHERDPRVLRARSREHLAEALRLSSEADRIDAEGASVAVVADAFVDVVNCERLFKLTKRAFADAARRGDFRSFRSGRRRVARYSDVEAFVTGRSAPSRRRSKPALIATTTPELAASYEATVGATAFPRRRSA
jgi:hypothetical protein